MCGERPIPQQWNCLNSKGWKTRQTIHDYNMLIEILFYLEQKNRFLLYKHGYLRFLTDREPFGIQHPIDFIKTRTWESCSLFHCLMRRNLKKLN